MLLSTHQCSTGRLIARPRPAARPQRGLARQTLRPQRAASRQLTTMVARECGRQA